MFCSNCGTKIEDGGKFCSNCGNRIGLNTTSFKTTSLLEKDFTNTSIGANLWKNEISLGGKIHFYENYFVFKSHAINLGQAEVTISYEDITDIQLVNYFGLAPTGLQITVKEKEVYRFVVWNRKKIKAFLEFKRGSRLYDRSKTNRSDSVGSK